MFLCGDVGLTAHYGTWTKTTSFVLAIVVERHTHSLQITMNLCNVRNLPIPVRDWQARCLTIATCTWTVKMRQPCTIILDITDELQHTHKWDTQELLLEWWHLTSFTNTCTSMLRKWGNHGGGSWLGQPENTDHCHVISSCLSPLPHFCQSGTQNLTHCWSALSALSEWNSHTSLQVHHPPELILVVQRRFCKLYVVMERLL